MFLYNLCDRYVYLYHNIYKYMPIRFIYTFECICVQNFTVYTRTVYVLCTCTQMFDKKFSLYPPPHTTHSFNCIFCAHTQFSHTAYDEPWVGYIIAKCILCKLAYAYVHTKCSTQNLMTEILIWVKSLL